MKKVFIIVFVLLLDACGDSGVSNNRLAVDNINVAGKKAPELKKVIDEYKDDKEKLKSSEFLIANMNYK